ncbi:toxin CcdB [Mesorhizobium soli]|jgi:toxin CcdB|uniref:CcdB family protein n=1 Tax=Pseudaminobacter soli (ex Li et al. 2025) TaxID=1295366 RepID=UPI0024745021|nr:CcdB family protein [Mesorhizobium soli]MDH6234008.1 toxin CcdB [Mesorhizobium soli]
MARYNVYANPGGGYILDVQADLLDELKTRVVVPLLPLDAAPLPARRLNPVFEIEGESCAMVTQFMAAVPISALATPVANLSAHHDHIVAALDMVFHGF